MYSATTLPYVYLWFSEESLYLLPIRIAIALFFFYSCYSSLMSCTILHFVVQAFCINLGTLFLSEIILFPTWIKFSNFHNLHWLIHHSFIFILLLFFYFCGVCVHVSFCGGIFYTPAFCTFLSIIKLLFAWLFLSLVLKTDKNYVPMIFLISMFPHNIFLHSGCRNLVLHPLARISIV